MLSEVEGAGTSGVWSAVWNGLEAEGHDLGDREGSTPLLVAAMEGHEAVVVKLLAQGAQIELRFQGLTALEIAERQDTHEDRG